MSSFSSISKKRAKKKNERGACLQNERLKAKGKFEAYPNGLDSSRRREAQKKLEEFYEERVLKFHYSVSR